MNELLNQTLFFFFCPQINEVTFWRSTLLTNAFLKFFPINIATRTINLNTTQIR